MFRAETVLPVREISLLVIAEQIETIGKVERGINYNGSSRKMCCWIELKVDKVQDYFTCAVYTLTFGII
jgi:hypothetical protein